ncbi:DUF3016 domain-containing protein [Thalassotalea euphylliae]|uniref:DUF3016 domain-containing protein n=1 Tax=Thalassotalea euphylliae TaxID=1655234 RepID=A0A3E0U6S7_9GAMM|nr:DUF3016 domain-containing protein [Thalassotalea euphylliae]REL31632.1 DUF3016 domain-containing protein [Thalassotalea euphylliae]
MMQFIPVFTSCFQRCTRAAMVMAILFSTMSSQLLAASVEVEWREPDNYRDIHPGGNSREQFRATTFADLERNFGELAKSLPDSQTLKIVVRDLDLAGYVNVDSKTQRRRFISSTYFPRMKFTYKLYDDAGQVIKAGGAYLKKPDFIATTANIYKDKTLGYEKQMIDQWYAETFMPSESE